MPFGLFQFYPVVRVMCLISFDLPCQINFLMNYLLTFVSLLSNLVPLVSNGNVSK